MAYVLDSVVSGRAKKSFLLAICVLFLSSTAFANYGEPPNGALLRVQGHGFVSRSEIQETGEWNLFGGPAVSLNFGIGIKKSYRFGIEGRFDTGIDRLAHGSTTSLDGVLRLGVGPTFAYRFRGKPALELEAQLLFSRAQFLGARAVAGGGGTSRDPLGHDHVGPRFGANLLWRPWGWDSLFGLHAGAFGSVAVASDGNGTTEVALIPQIGLTLGY